MKACLAVRLPCCGSLRLSVYPLLVASFLFSSFCVVLQQTLISARRLSYTRTCQAGGGDGAQLCLYGTGPPPLFLWIRLASTSRSPSLHPPRTGIAGVYPHTFFSSAFESLVWCSVLGGTLFSPHSVLGRVPFPTQQLDAVTHFLLTCDVSAQTLNRTQVELSGL